MKITIDSNHVIAALIKDSTTRKILFDESFEFSTPDFITQEIYKHKDRIAETSDMSEGDFEIVLALIFEHINIIPKSDYDELISDCKSGIKDEKDVAYVAACLATKSEGIWTHDPHFKEQKKVNVFTNIDMLRLSGKNIG